MSNSNKSTDISATDQKEEQDLTSRVTLYNFTEQGKGKWRVQDDVVMGGRSDSQLTMTEEDRARFSGHVSLENNGGFCSIHQTVENDPYVFSSKSAFALLLKGDGKDYNFRVRTPKGRHSYGFTFPTKGSGDWETISIPFHAMEATYHGEPVDLPNYAGEKVVEMQILIGNKKEESFELLIEAIEVI